MLLCTFQICITSVTCFDHTARLSQKNCWYSRIPCSSRLSRTSPASGLSENVENAIYTPPAVPGSLRPHTFQTPGTIGSACSNSTVAHLSFETPVPLIFQKQALTTDPRSTPTCPQLASQPPADPCSLRCNLDSRAGKVAETLHLPSLNPKLSKDSLLQHQPPTLAALSSASLPLPSVTDITRLMETQALLTPAGEAPPHLLVGTPRTGATVRACPLFDPVNTPPGSAFGSPVEATDTNPGTLSSGNSAEPLRRMTYTRCALFSESLNNSPRGCLVSAESSPREGLISAESLPRECAVSADSSSREFLVSADSSPRDATTQDKPLLFPAQPLPPCAVVRDVPENGECKAAVSAPASLSKNDTKASSIAGAPSLPLVAPAETERKPVTFSLAVPSSTCPVINPDTKNATPGINPDTGSTAQEAAQVPSQSQDAFKPPHLQNPDGTATGCALASSAPLDCGLNMADDRKGLGATPATGENIGACAEFGAHHHLPNVTSKIYLPNVAPKDYLPNVRAGNIGGIEEVGAHHHLPNVINPKHHLPAAPAVERSMGPSEWVSMDCEGGPAMSLLFENQSMKAEREELKRELRTISERVCFGPCKPAASIGF
jgi:hypothetical protein